MKGIVNLAAGVAALTFAAAAFIAGLWTVLGTAAGLLSLVRVS